MHDPQVSVKLALPLLNIIYIVNKSLELDT